MPIATASFWSQSGTGYSKWIFALLLGEMSRNDTYLRLLLPHLFYLLLLARSPAGGPIRSSAVAGFLCAQSDPPQTNLHGGVLLSIASDLQHIFVSLRILKSFLAAHPTSLAALARNVPGPMPLMPSGYSLPSVSPFMGIH